MMYQGKLRPAIGWKTGLVNLFTLLLIMAVTIPTMLFLVDRAAGIYKQERVERDRQALIMAIGALRQAGD